MAVGSRMIAPIPTRLTRRLAERLLPPPDADADERPAFDLLRASINLTVASVLIAAGIGMQPQRHRIVVRKQIGAVGVEKAQIHELAQELNKENKT